MASEGAPDGCARPWKSIQPAGAERRPAGNTEERRQTCKTSSETKIDNKRNTPTTPVPPCPKSENNKRKPPQPARFPLLNKTNQKDKPPNNPEPSRQQRKRKDNKKKDSPLLESRPERPSAVLAGPLFRQAPDRDRWAPGRARPIATRRFMAIAANPRPNDIRRFMATPPLLKRGTSNAHTGTRRSSKDHIWQLPW